MRKMDEEDRSNIKFIASLVLLLAGVVIVFISIFLPPIGTISPSVLTFFGEIIAFIGAVWGITEHAQIQIRKIDKQADISIEKKKKTEDEEN